MTSTRKKVIGMAGAALCCSIAWFAFFARYVLRHLDEPAETTPQWMGYACGIAAMVGMISIAILVTSVTFGLFRRADKNPEAPNQES